jgi:uncharacterized protein YndB with AHSA1/START domain
MGRAAEIRTVDLPPDRAFALWTDLGRAPSFVEGFAHAEEADGWPEKGGKLVWRSVPGGRGTVTERVVESERPRRLVTLVFEDRLEGRQTITFEPAEEGSRVTLELDWKLLGGGPFGFLTDALFVRPRQREALGRTLRRFGVEAAEEGAR